MGMVFVILIIAAPLAEIVDIQGLTGWIDIPGDLELGAVLIVIGWPRSRADVGNRGIHGIGRRLGKFQGAVFLQGKNLGHDS